MSWHNDQAISVMLLSKYKDKLPFENDDKNDDSDDDENSHKNSSYNGAVVSSDVIWSLYLN